MKPKSYGKTTIYLNKETFAAYCKLQELSGKEFSISEVCSVAILKEAERMEKLSRALDIRVDNLELSVRTASCLKALNIKTIGELVTFTSSQLLMLNGNLGRRCINELCDTLAEYELSLRKEH